MNYICYYRVSTKAQGRSGLGLGDQRSIVNRYLRDDDNFFRNSRKLSPVRGEIGQNSKKLSGHVRRQGAKLLIAKLDRLSRNVAFVMTLRDSGVDFVACDLPDANTLTVGMMVTFAQYEAERTSERTRAALAQKKAQGFKLGKPENLTFTGYSERGIYPGR